MRALLRCRQRARRLPSSFGRARTGCRADVHAALQAARQAPAIIFLDELDGLAPPRSHRAGGSDQVFASVVSTLLSLMDGLTDRGDVVVLAATNKRAPPGCSQVVSHRGLVAQRQQ